MLEKKGKGHGIRELITNVYEGVPDLMVKVDGAKAATFGLTAVDVERQRATSWGRRPPSSANRGLASLTLTCASDIIRFGRQRFDPDIVPN